MPHMGSFDLGGEPGPTVAQKVGAPQGLAGGTLGGHAPCVPRSSLRHLLVALLPAAALLFACASAPCDALESQCDKCPVGSPNAPGERGKCKYFVTWLSDTGCEAVLDL